MAPFMLDQVVADDLPAIFRVFFQAFNNPHNLARQIFAHRTDEETTWRLNRLIHNYNTDSCGRWDKLVDNATGRIVAFTVWQLPRVKMSDEDEKSRKAEKAAAESEFKKRYKFPEDGNERLMNDFWTATAGMRDKYVDTAKDYVLKLIAVLPEYQGQGCARLLIKAGLEVVDAAAGRTELEATPMAKPIYERYGFKEIDEMVFRLDQYGSQGTHVTTCMMRDVQKARAD